MKRADQPLTHGGLTLNDLREMRRSNTLQHDDFYIPPSAGEVVRSHPAFSPVERYEHKVNVQLGEIGKIDGFRFIVSHPTLRDIARETRMKEASRIRGATR